MLFDEVVSTTTEKKKIEEFLIDVGEFKKSIDSGPVDPAPEVYLKESLSQIPGMQWLNFVDPVLMSAPTEDPIQQKEVLQNFIEHLKTECSVEIGADFSQIFPEDFTPQKVLALDLETTGLDTRTKYNKDLKLEPQTKIVGISIAPNDTKGYYLPVLHSQGDGNLNWDYEVSIWFLTQLNQIFLTVIHNSQYDREVMSLNQVEMRPFPYFLDTLVLSFIQDSNRKSNGLKVLSEDLLGRKMVEIHQLFHDPSEKKKKNTLIEFEKLPVCNSYVYAASDSMNTFGLFAYFGMQSPEENIFINQYVPIQIDHNMIDVLRNLYRSGVPIDFDYCLLSVKDLIYRIILMEQEIYKLVGERFDIQSPAQLSYILFDQLKIPILTRKVNNKPVMERGKPTKAYPKGVYTTAEDILEELYGEHPDITVLEYVVTYRKLQKSAATLFLKMLSNSWVDGFLPFTRVQAQYMMSVIPTGRLSSSSNMGKEGVVVSETETGKLSVSYDKGGWACGFNTQGITKSSYKMQSAKKIRNLPPEAGLDFQDPYGDAVMDTLIKMIAGV